MDKYDEIRDLVWLEIGEQYPSLFTPRDPTDVGEWVDVIILAFDGAWRAGWEPQEILDAIKAKQERNEQRTWPDWRTAEPNKAIEHIRTA